MCSDLQSDTLTVERYKYILSQKANLDSRSFTILSLFQSLFILAIGAAALLVTNRGQISADVFKLALDALGFGVAGLGTFSALLLISGIIAWHNYKVDQAEIDGIGKPVRFRLRKMFGWYESYLLVAVVGFSTGFLFMLQKMY